MLVDKLFPVHLLQSQLPLAVDWLLIYHSLAFSLSGLSFLLPYCSSGLTSQINHLQENVSQVVHGSRRQRSQDKTSFLIVGDSGSFPFFLLLVQTSHNFSAPCKRVILLKCKSAFGIPKLRVFHGYAPVPRKHLGISWVSKALHDLSTLYAQAPYSTLLSSHLWLQMHWTTSPILFRKGLCTRCSLCSEWISGIFSLFLASSNPSLLFNLHLSFRSLIGCHSIGKRNFSRCPKWGHLEELLLTSYDIS